MTSKILAALLLMTAIAEAQPQAAPPAPPLMTKDLIGAPGKEVRMLTVTSAPGASSPVHRHNAQVFVYILSGTMQMQVKGQAPVTLGPGQTFYEAPEDIHVQSRNLSKTEPAKFLVVMVSDKGAPTTVPVK
jgi:quercetin dioxygenase-like cupin family protein